MNEINYKTQKQFHACMQIVRLKGYITNTESNLDLTISWMTMEQFAFHVE